MLSSIYINTNGLIVACSIYASEYPFVCPDFITFENFTTMKCIDIHDHMNPESWIEIENIENEIN